MKKYQIYILLFLGTLLYSCSESKEKGGESKSLPPSAGAIGDLLLVVDTNQLNTPLGKALENVFLQPYDGLPEIEANFKLTRIHFPAFGSLFKKAKTVLFAVPFNDGISKGHIKRMIGEEATKKILTNKKPYLVKENVFAKDQQIVFVFGETAKEVANNLKKYGETITSIINKKEMERVKYKLYGVKERKKMTEKLKSDLGFTLRVPANYRLVSGTKECTWITLQLEEIDYHIMVSERPYTDQSQFDSSYISEWRTTLAKNVDGGDSSSVKIVQSIYPITDKVFTSPYRIESRGLWKLKNNARGGPFVSEVKLSNDGEKIYYIEGFVVAPGKKKRELIREVEVIMSTFDS